MKIELKPMPPEDAALFRELTQNCDFALTTCRPVSTRRMDYDTFLAKPGNAMLGVYLREGADRILAGQVTVFDYNPRNRSAEFGYRLLEAYQGRGIMRAALGILIDAAVGDDKPLNKLYAQTAAFNEKSIALLTALGFHRDAVLREHHERGGALYDDWVFSLTAGDLRIS
ncbi:MAG: GNAT family N-acetyltransferase [Firmicutes bacterium]|nr:GNAT family N-acetyltransferase [Bacillota bacterium]